jgi:hypothetical protein
MAMVDDGESKCFLVVKVHHERGWLKQKRVLIITTTHIMKAHATNDSTNANDHETLKPTKTHSLDSLLAMNMTSRDTFSLHFRGDHPYYYCSEDAILIAQIVKRRRQFVVASMTLSPGAPDRIAAEFRAGRIDLPVERDVAALQIQTLDLMQSVRAGALDSSKDVEELRRRYEELNESPPLWPPDPPLEFRTKADGIKAMFMHQLMTRERSLLSKLHGKTERRKLPKFTDEDEARLCVEEALQYMLLSKAVFNILWTSVTRRYEHEQRRVDETIRWLSFKPVSHFGIHKDFEQVKFDLVRDQLTQLSRCFSPTAMLSSIFAAVRNIVVCVEVHYLLEPGELADSTSRTTGDYTTDDVLPMLIYIIVCCGVKNLLFARRFVEAVGDGREATERSYYFTVFSSAVQYLLEWRETDRSCSSGSMHCDDQATESPHSRMHSPFSTPRLLIEPSSASSRFQPS